MSRPELPALEPFDAHNERLADRVHPDDWQPPVPADRYNLVVIGGGTAGLVTAAGAAGLGAKVALVERGLLGGDCLNVGCVPSKALLEAARVVATVKRRQAYGLRCKSPVTTDFGSVMERLRRLRADISENDSAQRFRDLGVDVFLGEARFEGDRTVRVDDVTLHFAKACIATGARASAPPIDGLEAAGYRTNETLFSLTELPQRLAIIGGGPIGCEMAQAFARFGSEVTVLEGGTRLLGNDSPEAARIVAESLASDGVDIRTEAQVQRVEQTEGTRRLHASNGEPLEVDEILVATGRKPNVDGLGLEALGIEHDPKKGIAVDDRLRTSHPHVYAAGDVCSRYQFTHAADAMARIVIRNALFFGRAKVSSLVMPWCTYTDPEVAHVGPRHTELAERDDVHSTRIELADVDRARLDGSSDGFLEVHTDRKGRILAATLVAPHAGESISEIAVAIRAGMKLSDLSEVIHPYPTQAEIIRKAGDAFNRTKLTPTVAKWMSRFLAWRR
ncbi:MAG: mercuric reductase [Planctomycetota bacterium]